MFKRVILSFCLCSVFAFSCVYAASNSSPTIIRIDGIDEDNFDEYGNEKGYEYYNDYSDMPQNITYSQKEKNNNPDNSLKINFKAPNVKNATYNLGKNSGTIKCDGVTYSLSKRNDEGNYERVIIGGRAYKLTDGFITSRENTDYYYNNKAYSVDAVGNFYAYKHVWVEDTIHDKVYGDWQETNELLLKYEIPFNTLWKNRPLSEEEMEDYLNGPGYNINMNDNLGQNGDVNVIGSTREIEVTDEESIVSGKPKSLNDALNPMNAKSTKKQKTK